MSSPSFIVYEVPSRRFKRVIAIPWAEPAPVVAVPYPSFARKPTLKRRETERFHLVAPDASAYIVFEADASTFLPAWTAKKTNKTRFDRQHLTPQELSNYPVTPQEASEFLPAWTAKAANQTQFKRHLKVAPHLNEFPPTPAVPEQPPTAFLAPEKFRTAQNRQLLKPLIPPVYPVTPVSVSLLSFGVTSLITDTGGVSSAITDTRGVTSTITSTKGVTSSMTDVTG